MESAPAQDAAKSGDRPLRYEGDGPAALSYALSLRQGRAKGYAVCATPLRFAKLPDAVVTAYAEIGEPECGYVFEAEADAKRRLEQISAESRLGWNFSIREVHYQTEKRPWDGPTLDVSGHPFEEVRLFVVARSGAMARWHHGGRIGWRDGVNTAPGVEAGESIFRELQARLFKRKRRT